MLKAEGVFAGGGKKGLASQTATLQTNRKSQEPADQQCQHAWPRRLHDKFLNLPGELQISRVGDDLKVPWVD